MSTPLPPLIRREKEESLRLIVFHKVIPGAGYTWESTTDCHIARPIIPRAATNKAIVNQVRCLECLTKFSLLRYVKPEIISWADGLVVLVVENPSFSFINLITLLADSISVSDNSLVLSLDILSPPYYLEKDHITINRGKVNKGLDKYKV